MAQKTEKYCIIINLKFKKAIENQNQKQLNINPSCILVQDLSV